MKVLQILRAWRARSPVEGRASAADIEAASKIFEAYEKALGPGRTVEALDLAIEEEAFRVAGKPKHRARRHKEPS